MPVEILTKGVLHSLNKGVQYLSLEIDCTQTPPLTQSILSLYLLMTIASARHHTGYVYNANQTPTSLEHFTHCLGYCQLHQYILLNLTRPPHEEL